MCGSAPLAVGMLITSDFVVINMPKTGSTFLRTVLAEIYRASRPQAEFRELMLPHLEDGTTDPA